MPALCLDPVGYLARGRVLQAVSAWRYKSVLTEDSTAASAAINSPMKCPTFACISVHSVAVASAVVALSGCPFAVLLLLLLLPFVVNGIVTAWPASQSESGLLLLLRDTDCFEQSKTDRRSKALPSANCRHPGTPQPNRLFLLRKNSLGRRQQLI